VIGSTRQVTVYAYAHPVDMRKSFDTLAVLVSKELGRDVLSGDVFLFVGKTLRRAKVLYFDGTGLCLFAKRLEKGRFAAPWQRRADVSLRWTMSELSLFLEGSELVGRVPLSPEPWRPAARAASAA
jgi:transposase